MSNIFSIPPGTPFLPTLIEALYDGTLVGKIGGEDSLRDNSPFELCDITIYLPTRRAMRELTRLLQQRQSEKTILLPKIITFNTTDEDEIYFHSLLDKNVSSENFIPVSPLSRNLQLANEIQKNTKNKNGINEIGEILSSSPAQCFAYAKEISLLLDQFTKEGIDWSEFKKIDCEDYADWWRRTQIFLQIATEGWRNQLKEKNQVDPAQLYVDELLAQAKIYESGKHNAPVIAAGSTGSVATTMYLLKAIAKMQRGAVVLPGLDNYLTKELWETLSTKESASNESQDKGKKEIFSHPQYGLRHLLLGLEVEREQVRELPLAVSKNSRNAFISKSLIPSDATDLWYKHSEDKVDIDKACENISLIVAPDEHKEALAIALAMRESLETMPKGHSGLHAALITRDRKLAHRVSVELQRFGINIDDSANQSLLHTSHGNFLRLAAALAFETFDSIILLSLLRHDLFFLGGKKNKYDKGIKLLEFALLRANARPLSFGNLKDELKKVQDSLQDDIYAKMKLNRFKKEEYWQQAYELCEKLDTIFALEQFSNLQGKDLIISFIKIAELLSIDEKQSFSFLYGGDNGKSLNSLFVELCEQDIFPKISCDEFCYFLKQLLLETVVASPSHNKHPHLAILGTLESRLQNFNLVILGGLNEGTWPSLSSDDLFLSRSMKLQLGLPLPERRTGLASHDFQMLLGFENVIISRAENLSGSPTFESRWVQRLTTLAGVKLTEKMQERGKKYLYWANLLNESNETLPAISRPAPCPAVNLRPRKLSISDIGRWIENPYEIYAKHILKLRPLDSLRSQLGHMERGSLFHDIFDEFISQDASSDKLLEIAEKHFSKQAIPADVKILWHTRLIRIIEMFIRWHESYKGQIQKSFTEINVDYKFEDLNFTIKGRADRIDKLKNGQVIIYDYKTGTTPSINSVRDLQSPQLLITALLANRGAFAEIGEAQVSNVAYIRLREEQELPIDFLAKETEKELITKTISEIDGKLRNLISAFDNESQAYSVKRTFVPKGKFAGFGDDYAHLARTLEWSLIDEEEQS